MSNFNKDAQKLKELYLDFQNKSKMFTLKYNQEIVEIIKEYLSYTNRYYNPHSKLESINSFEDDYVDIRISESFEEISLDFPEKLLLDTDNFLKPFREAYQERIKKQALIDKEIKDKKELEEKEMLAKLKAKYE